VFLLIAQYEQSNTTLVVRSRLQPPEISSVLQTLITNIDPNVPYTVRSWPDALASVLFPARAATMSLGIMGCLAVMLAITGIFGMAAYSVSKRMKEFGIRMAVGCTTHSASAHSLRRSARLVVERFSSRLALGRALQPATCPDCVPRHTRGPACTLWSDPGDGHGWHVGHLASCPTSPYD
jgi:hypothetical protein